jgi:hypothetical protein
MVVMAARTACEFMLRPDLEAPAQALTERLIDARGHRHLDHWHKRAGLKQMVQCSQPPTEEPTPAATVGFGHNRGPAGASR